MPRKTRNTLEINSVFARWTVLSKQPSRISKNGSQHRALYLCRCVCGAEKIVLASALRLGESLSCGCLRTEKVTAAHRKHGRYENYPRAYSKVKSAWQRCYDPNSSSYPRYGGRGIEFSPEFLLPDGSANYSAFVDYLVNILGWDESSNLTLDRINPNGGYCPGNLRLATWSVQNRNKQKTYPPSVIAFIKAASPITGNARSTSSNQIAKQLGTSAQYIRQIWDGAFWSEVKNNA